MNKKSITSSKKIYDLCTVALSAAFITVCAWICIPFPISVTLQTFGICVVCGILGFKKGVLSVLIYILLGLVGLPVFSGFRSGISALTDQSGGYIIGFLLLAITVGVASHLFEKRILPLALSMLVGVLTCYLCGALWYYFGYAGEASFGTVISLCVLPFIIPDVIKILLAATVVKYVGRAMSRSRH